MENENTEISLKSIAEVVNGYQQSRVLLTAVELEIFTILGKSKKTSEEIAGEAVTAPRATDRLLCALVAMGFLEKNGDYFNNTPTTRKYLDQQSPDFMWMLKHTANKWDGWSTLTDAVRKGTSVFEDDNAIKNRKKSGWGESFIGAMHYRAQGDADALVTTLGTENVKSMLDVGGGSGAYAMAFCRENPEMKATVLDLPDILPITKRYIAEAGMADRVNTISGSYHTADFGSGYDLILMSAIIHINSDEENHRLIAKGAEALNPGGRLVIRDFIVDENRVSPLKAVMFSLNMLTATSSGDTYTEKEMSVWMRDAGLRDIQRIDYADRQNLLVGVK